MRFVSVRELRGQSAAVWKTLANEKDLIVTSNGKPIALLSAMSDENLEESLSALRRARAQAAATAMQQASVRAGTDRLSLQDINAEIDATRKQRSR
jgi:antitoxin (DNA-binding transcriptional repressor) of toxin-antitoxin stability system